MALAVFGADPHPAAAMAAQLSSIAISQQRRGFTDDKA
jgi:hypothetical protein